MDWLEQNSLPYISYAYQSDYVNNWWTLMHLLKKKKKNFSVTQLIHCGCGVQELQDREGQVQQLQCECEEAHRDKDSNAIFASDMGREIEQLKKVGC